MIAGCSPEAAHPQPGSCAHADTAAVATIAIVDHVRNEWMRQVADESPAQVRDALRLSVKLDLRAARTVSSGPVKLCAAVLVATPSAAGSAHLQSQRGWLHALARVGANQVGSSFELPIEYMPALSDDGRTVVVSLPASLSTAAAVEVLGILASNELSLTNPDWR